MVALRIPLTTSLNRSVGTTCLAGNQLCRHSYADGHFSSRPEFVRRELKRPMREADRSCPTSVEVKNAWSCIPSYLYVFATLYLMERILPLT